MLNKLKSASVQLNKMISIDKKVKGPKIKASLLTRDVFEHVDDAQKMDAEKEVRRYSSNDNLQFATEVLRFYPEDVEKMRSMSIEERIEYRRQLKEQNRFIIVAKIKNMKK